jgi:polar amino acid transport system substrate-binding protein
MKGSTISGYTLSFIFLIVLAIAFPCLASGQAISAKDLTYITEQFPPFNYQEDGKLKGISVELLETAWQKMGEDLNRSAIAVLPWTEGYKRTIEENNTVLFTVGRIPEREELFKWAGPIGSSWYVLLAKTEKNINVTTPEDLKKLKIGAIEDDLAIQLLSDKGVPKEDLVLEKTSEPIIDMLKNGSIDAWAYNDVTGIWQLQKFGEKASDYKVVYVFGSSDGYLAFNKGVPDSLVQSFQESLDSIKNEKDGNDYEKILTKYAPGIREL